MHACVIAAIVMMWGQVTHPDQPTANLSGDWEIAGSAIQLVDVAGRRVTVEAPFGGAFTVTERPDRVTFSIPGRDRVVLVTAIGRHARPNVAAEPMTVVGRWIGRRLVIAGATSRPDRRDDAMLWIDDDGALVFAWKPRVPDADALPVVVFVYRRAGG